MPRARVRFWTVLAAVELFYAVEVVLKLRFTLAQAVRALLQGQAWYPHKRSIQMVCVAVAATGLFAVLLVRRGRLSRPAALAIGGMLVTGLALTAETISLHEMDRWLYAPAGPVLRVASWWSTGAGLVITAATITSVRVLRKAG